MCGVHQLKLVTLTLAAGCGLAFAPDSFPAMLARAFLPWWAVLFLGLAALAMARGRWWWSASGFIAAALVAAPLRVPVPDPVGKDGGSGLRVATMNLWQVNGRRSDAVRSAVATDADVIAFQEVNAIWAAALEEGLAVRYPYRRAVPREDCYGIALFSRFPIGAIRVAEVEGTPFILADAETDGGTVRICAAHAASPTSLMDFRRRNAQLRWLAREMGASDHPMLVIGDLNTVHWDDAYRRLCRASGGRPASTPLDITWPSFGPLALIPIDHVLLRGPVEPAALSTFEVAGSDHRGIVADIILTHES
jgi:endonuclease/exonuclease/phosphatase (EEP) superfamily protein YafD